MNNNRVGRQSVLCFFCVISALILSSCANTTVSRPSQDLAKEVVAEYRIGPGDRLSVMVWKNPDLSMAVPVRPDGKITTPLVQDLLASGRTPSELAREIEAILAKYVHDPIVTVVVTDFVGRYTEQVRVIGQATKPQALSYREGMSLMDVLISVGGITEFAAGNRASIIRHSEGQSQKVAVRIDDLIRNGDISANMKMKPGDILVIPESFF